MSRTVATDTGRLSLGHLPALDGLRGVAILLVLLTHVIALPLDPHAMPDAWIRAFARLGWSGVDLFFVLSGFLITGVLLDTKGVPHCLRNYFARRVLRVFPLYYGVLLAIFVIVPAVSSWSSPAFATLRGNQAWYWTYTVNILEAVKGPGAAPLNTSHFWSLSIEEQFYLVWPLIVVRSNPRTLVRIALGVMVAGLVVRLAYILGQGDVMAAYLLTPCRLDGLMVGGVLAVVARRPGGLAVLRGVAARTFLTAATALAAVAWWRGGFEYRDPVLAVIVYPGLALVYGSLVVLALTPRPGSGALARMLSNPHLRNWGKYSYAIYILHYPLLMVLEAKLPYVPAVLITPDRSHPGAVALLAAVAVPSAYALGWLSYHLYETHFLALKRYV